MCRKGALGSRCAAHFNVHALRVIPNGNFFLGKGLAGFGKMYGRRSLNPLNNTMGSTTVHHRVHVLGSVNYGTVHASRGVPTPRLIRTYSRVNVVLVIRSFSR